MLGSELAEGYFFSFNRSRISVRSFSSAVGSGSGAGAGAEVHQVVHPLPHHEYAEGQNHEVNHLLDEGTILPYHLGYGRGGLGSLLTLLEHYAQVAEVGIAQEHTDRRHQDIVHQRGNDLTKGTTDNHTDSHVHYITLEGKGFEFFQKSHNYYLFLRLKMLVWWNKSRKKISKMPSFRLFDRQNDKFSLGEDKIFRFFV